MEMTETILTEALLKTPGTQFKSNKTILDTPYNTYEVGENADVIFNLDHSEVYSIQQYNDNSFTVFCKVLGVPKNITFNYNYFKIV